MRVDPMTDANDVEEAGQDDARTLSVQYDDHWREASRKQRIRIS